MLGMVLKFFSFAKCNITFYDKLGSNKKKKRGFFQFPFDNHRVIS